MKKKGTKLAQWLFNSLKIKNGDYPKVTFRLSVIGFIGSIGFYIGVLRDLGIDPIDKNREIENLRKENERLEDHIDLLIEKR